MRKRENSAAKRWLFKFACDLVFTFVFCIHLGYLALIPRIYGFCSPKFFKLVLLEFLCSLLCVPFGSDFPSQFHGVVNFGLFPGKQSHPLRVSSQLSTGGTDDSGNFAMLYVVTPGPRRRQHSLRPSVFSCSFLTITTSVGRLGHAAHAQVPPIPCLSTPAGQARAIATQVLRDAAIRRLELKGKILGGRRHLPPSNATSGDQ